MKLLTTVGKVKSHHCRKGEIIDHCRKGNIFTSVNTKILFSVPGAFLRVIFMHKVAALPVPVVSSDFF